MKENLYKIQASKKFLEQIEADLWQGAVKEAISSELSKYKHLGKAGTPDHIDAVMSVFRCSVIDEIQRIIRSLDDCLLDITSGAEQEEEKPQD